MHKQIYIYTYIRKYKQMYIINIIKFDEHGIKWYDCCE